MPSDQKADTPRILVVEDDTTVASFIAMKLAELGYTSVGQATTGRQAVTLAGQLRPNLILMDVMLEGDMDGIAAARAIREQLPIPVVFLTAFSNDEIIERAKMAGPLGYIIKPFTDRELRTGIEMALYKHEAEAKLQVAEERLRLVLLGSNDGIWDRDLTGGELFYSSRWFEMLGYAPGELQVGPEMWINLVHPDDAGYARQLQESSWASAASNYTIEVRLRHKHGHFVPILSRAYIVRDADGKAIRVAGTTTDMSASKQAQAELRASDQRFRDLVDSTDGIVWEADAKTFMFTYVSSNAERLLGYPAADWLQPGFWASHIHPDDREQAVQYCASCTGRLEDHDFEYRFMTLDGRVAWLRDIVRVVVEDGRQRWLRGLMVDITERKAASRILEESLREKAALLREVHHRVKNNLQVINSLLRLEAGRSDQSSTRSVLGDMQGRIQSMALLHESLYRSGTIASVDLGAYLGQISKQAFRALTDSRGAIQLRLDMTAVHVTMDQALPCGLLVNELVSNCLKHGFPDGRSGEVTVELTDEDGDGRLCLRVSDTGIGLPADFESRRGNSLGLQLVADLAQQLGGTFEVRSGPVAMFTLSFDADRQPSGRPA